MYVYIHVYIYSYCKMHFNKRKPGGLNISFLSILPSLVFLQYLLKQTRLKKNKKNNSNNQKKKKKENPLFNKTRQYNIQTFDKLMGEFFSSIGQEKSKLIKSNLLVLTETAARRK